MAFSRLTAVTAGFTLAYGLLVFHLYQLQVEKGEYYVARADSQTGFSASGYGARGSIYFTDRAGTRMPAVSNKSFPTVYAVPKVIEDPQEAASQVAPILGLDRNDLSLRFSRPNDLYELLARKVPDDAAGRIEALALKGVYVESANERFYPFGKLAAHLLGYLGPNEENAGMSGHYGLEEYYNDALRGAPGSESGDDLILTIDPNIQLEAERVADRLMTEHKGKAASVVVEDPNTGKILAMASAPAFDPNNYKDANVRTFLNPVAQEVYEPGSVFKIITMAAGIDSGAITPDTTFNDTGVLKLNGRKIQNWDLSAHGVVTMTNVIEKSLNTGAAFAEMKTGNAAFTDYVKRFGFGEKTGIDIPGEVRGDVRRLNDKSPAVAFATASFGQGVAVSTIELASAFSAIANGGTLMRPYVNDALGEKKIRNVVSAETASKVTGMMVSALEKAEIAHIKGYSIAGKTGTAQVPDLVHGGYSDRVIDTYAGFGPTSNPRFVIILKLSEPEGAPLAGTTVVPAFRDLAQFILNYYNIPPDKLE